MKAIVVGVGAMGSAACWALAKRGVKVVGLEQHTVGHALGSSHGESRLIRKAYFEHPAYVPLLHRAYELWRELDEGLLHETGLVIYGPREGGRVLPGVRRSGIPVEEVEGYAQFVPPDDYVGLLERGAGWLEVERCVRVMASRAKELGAQIVEGARVGALEELRAERIVVTAGPWSGQFLRDLPLTVRRVTMFWFPQPADWRDLPCFAFDLDDGFYYGVPEGGMVKVARHVPGEVVEDASKVRREIDEQDLAPVRAFVQRCLPSLDATPVRAAVCMYTMTPDEHFIIDREGAVTFAAGFSGHGFKFAPVVGEIVADLAIDGETRHPIDFLRRR